MDLLSCLYILLFIFYYILNILNLTILDFTLMRKRNHGFIVLSLSLYSIIYILLYIKYILNILIKYI